MGGSDLQYRTRPNKHIDRELFVALLERIVSSKGARSYAYISMGGEHLVDHYLVYRRTGIRNLVSFDKSQSNVKRQEFNKPVQSMNCLCIESGELAAKIDEQFETGDDTEINIIVWLDFTSPNERHYQMRQVEELASRMTSGDVLRVTLNANTQNLSEDPNDSTEWSTKGFQSPGVWRAHRFKEQIGEYFPDRFDEAISDNEFPYALVWAVDKAMTRASESRGNIRFEQVFNTTYADGQRMVTACFLGLDDESDHIPMSVSSWEYLPESKGELLWIEAPNLSMREKLAIDEKINLSADEIVDSLEYATEEKKERYRKEIVSYQRIHRYYPWFQSIDL